MVLIIIRPWCYISQWIAVHYDGNTCFQKVTESNDVCVHVVTKLHLLKITQNDHITWIILSKVWIWTKSLKPFVVVGIILDIFATMSGKYMEISSGPPNLDIENTDPLHMSF